MTLSDLKPWLPRFRCPHDRAKLLEREDLSALQCQTCEKIFPFQDGILRFVEGQVGEISGSPEKFQEMLARDQYANEYDRHFSPLVNRIEIPPYLKSIRSPGSLRSSGSLSIIELGAGTGRITRRYLSFAENVVALDFSLESLRYLKKKLTLEEQKKCLLVQADMTRLPFADSSFDKAVTFQVIEHLPGETCRIDSVREASRILKPDGEIVCSVYHYSRAKQKAGIRQEGFHDQNGVPIYFYHFKRGD